MAKTTIFHLPERFQDKISPEPNTGCWLWTGSLCQGYGRIKINNKPVPAHSAVYKILIKDIPNGLEPDHLCRNRQCVNPFHLELVTHAINMSRSAHTLKTHCPKGHIYDVRNTRIYRGSRACKKCDLIAHTKTKE